jgi:hypothetical protein
MIFWVKSSFRATDDKEKKGVLTKGRMVSIHSFCWESGESEGRPRFSLDSIQEGAYNRATFA